MTNGKRGLLVAGDQLFPAAELADLAGCPVFMAEDRGLCTRKRYHQQKLVLFLSAMREYADELRDRGYSLCYHELDMDSQQAYEDRLDAFVVERDLDGLVHFEIEDHFFDRRIADFCERRSLSRTVIESPMFLTSRQQFRDYLDDAKRPYMADFYKRQRRRLDILVTANGEPCGEQWSFDEQNRKKLPDSIEVPGLPEPKRTAHTDNVIKLVAGHFGDHPGCADDFQWPVTRRSALYWLRNFIDTRLARFGDYQDAITQRSETAFHGVLTPLLNTGLLTPRDVVDHALAAASDTNIPINSLEGFVRQVIGWREFIRGIYHEYDDELRKGNHWNHHRGLTDAWYSGDTGIPPLDDAIRTALRLGWTHHINRLMVVGNLMNLCEIEPEQVHDWFMEMHIDSADWVMGPNVYGMALFSDGGIFATKPYICGSNYILKMSDYAKGDWCDVVDGLYWRFVDNHRDFFVGNHRLSMMVRTLDKLQNDRRRKIFDAAERFLEIHTSSAGG